MLSKGELVAALVTGVVLGGLAGGCVVVIEDEVDPSVFSWRSDKEGSRPRMGIYLDEPGKTLATQLNLNRSESTVITGIKSNSPAERAGLQKYDIITRIDGSEEADPSDVSKAIRSKEWGESLTLTVLRNGQPMDVVVTLDRDVDRESPRY